MSLSVEYTNINNYKRKKVVSLLQRDPSERTHASCFPLLVVFSKFLVSTSSRKTKLPQKGKNKNESSNFYHNPILLRAVRYDKIILLISNN